LRVRELDAFEQAAAGVAAVSVAVSGVDEKVDGVSHAVGEAAVAVVNVSAAVSEVDAKVEDIKKDMVRVLEGMKPKEEATLVGALPIVGLNTNERRYVDGTRLSLFAAVREWAATPARADSSRVFWLMGDACVGKSVFASQCAVEFPSLVVAQRFCRYDNAVSQAKQLVRSVAHQLCKGLPSYREHLLSTVLPQLHGDEKLSESDLWERLLAVPLGVLWQRHRASCRAAVRRCAC